MAEIMVLKRHVGKHFAVLATPNIVKVSGTVKNGLDVLAERIVQLYKSGTSELVDETMSAASDGKFEILFQGDTSMKLRVLTFAKKGESDEQSKAFDFVTPIQITHLY